MPRIQVLLIQTILGTWSVEKKLSYACQDNGMPFGIWN